MLDIEKEIKEIELKFAEAVFDTHVMYQERIFEEGDDIKGNKSTYSSEPAWISRQNIPREAGKKSKSGKSRYFEGGYSEMKKAVGRRPFVLFGVLQNAIATGLRQVGLLKWELSIPDDKYLTTTNERNKNFFKLSDTEKKYLIKRLNEN